MPGCRSPPFLPEKQSVKRNGGLQNEKREKRILSICKRTKGKSQWGDIQSLLAGKRTWKVFRAGGQKKPLALFFVLGSGWTFCREHHWWDGSVDTKSEIVKILHFKQFYKHYVFVEDGEGGKKKLLKNHIEVNVCIDMVCGDTKNVFESEDE